MARLIAVQSAKSLEKMPGVSRRRVDTLPLACLALDKLLVALKPQERRLLGLRPARGFLLFASRAKRRGRVIR